jgi:hypothetical protein
MGLNCQIGHELLLSNPGKSFNLMITFKVNACQVNLSLSEIKKSRLLTAGMWKYFQN